MSRWIKPLLKIALCLIVIGCAMSGIAYLSGANTAISYGGGRGVRVIHTRQEAVRVWEPELAEFDTLVVNLNSGDLHVRRGESYSLELLSYTGDDGGGWLDYSVENGVLTISESPAAEGVTYMLVGGFFKNNNSRANLYVPEHAQLKEAVIKTAHGTAALEGLQADRVKVESSYGRVFMKNTAVEGLLDISMNNGPIELEDTVSSSLLVKNNYGNTAVKSTLSHTYDQIELAVQNGKGELSGLTATEMRLSNQYGSFELENVTAQSLEATLQNGRFLCNGAVVDDGKVDNRYGAVNISNWAGKRYSSQISNGNFSLQGTVTEYVQVTNRYGKIEIANAVDPEKCRVDVSSSYGSIEVEGQRFEGAYQNHPAAPECVMEIESSSGGVRLHFR